MGNYRLTRNAREDVGEILAFIAEDSIDAALGVNDKLDRAFQMLSENPAVGRERPEIDPQMRSFPVGAYVVFYKVVSGEVLIYRTIDCARDISDELRD